MGQTDDKPGQEWLQIQEKNNNLEKEIKIDYKSRQEGLQIGADFRDYKSGQERLQIRSGFTNSGKMDCNSGQNKSHFHFGLFNPLSARWVDINS